MLLFVLASLRRNWWSCLILKALSSKLPTYQSEFNLSTNLYPSQPIYWPTSNLKRLDFFDFFLYVQTSLPLTQMLLFSTIISSDHSPVILTLTFILKPPSCPSVIYGDVEQDVFCVCLSQKLKFNFSLKTFKQIDKNIELVPKSMQQSIWHATSTIHLP